MDFEYLFATVSFSASLFSALFCFVLIALKLALNPLDFFIKRLSLVLLCFYLVSIIFFITIFFYVFNLPLFWWFKALNFQSVLLIPVLFYHIVFKLTRLKKEERFKYSHYIVCLLVGGFYFVYAEFLMDQTVLSFPKEELKNSLFFNDGRILARIVFNSVYLLLAFQRLLQYRKHIIHYSSDESQDSLKWLYNIFIIALLLFPGPILFYSLPDMKNSLLYGQLIPNFLFMFFNISLCYNIFSQNFTLVYEDIAEDDKEIDNKKNKETPIDKTTFEAFIQTKKPYLDPQLKITDLMRDLLTNRTYLSSFINTTYSMNFSQFINQCRYNEYIELRKSNTDNDLTEEDLILASGFRSYDSFKRTQQNHSKKNE